MAPRFHRAQTMGNAAMRRSNQQEYTRFCLKNRYDHSNPYTAFCRNVFFSTLVLSRPLRVRIEAPGRFLK